MVLGCSQLKPSKKQTRSSLQEIEGHVRSMWCCGRARQPEEPDELGQRITHNAAEESMSPATVHKLHPKLSADAATEENGDPEDWSSVDEDGVCKD
eukprot:s5158_g1.t1